MTTGISVRDELEATVAEYHHVQGEHRRAGAEGSLRRHLHARLGRLGAHFERLLEESVADEVTRNAWRRRLHDGTPAPAEPRLPEHALLFKGRSAAGSVVEVGQRPDGDCDVVVDGSLLERVAAAKDLAEREIPLTFRIGDQEFQEIFEAPARVVAAARAYFSDPFGEPPWQRRPLRRRADRRHLRADPAGEPRPRRKEDTSMSAELELITVPIEKPEELNLILGQAHFIKTVEDLYEALAGSSPHLRFGLAFCESSGPRLVRRAGNDEELVELAVRNAVAIGAGHSFIVFLREGYPMNVLNQVKHVPEVCRVYCATANPVEVVLAETPHGRAILGVVDGASPLGVETAEDVAARRDLLRKIGYKL